MELNGYHSPINTPPVGSPATFYIEATIEEAAALNGQTLTMTHAGETVAIYPDYSITSITLESNGLIAVTAQRVLDPDIAATLERLEQGQTTQQATNQDIEETIAQLKKAQTDQVFTNHDTAERLDSVDAALIELAAIIADDAEEESIW